MIALKTVLVATDFSAPSETALEYGRALARTFNASLHVIHVVEDAMTPGIHAEIAPPYYGELQRSLEDSARKQLEGAVRDDDRRELNAQTVLLTSATPASGIVTYAKEAAVDIIVLGTHGWSGWSHFLMGSVAEKVVRTAPCPVLAVRHPQHEFLKPDALQLAAAQA